MFRRSMLGAFVVVGSARVAAGDPLYTIRDLGLLPGWTAVRPVAVNDAGVVVGTATAADGSHLFRYDGTMHDLGQFGGGTVAGGINAAGQIAGSAPGTSSSTHAFFYDGTFHDLGSLDAQASWGSSINDSGQIAGTLLYPNGVQHAFYYDGTMHDLLPVLGGNQGAAVGINNARQITGSIQQGSVRQAFLYDTAAQSMTVLTPSNASEAAAINSVGAIVGSLTAQIVPGLWRIQPFLWDGTMHQLPGSSLTPPPGVIVDPGDVLAEGINTAGQAVGYAEGTSQGPFGMLWDAATHRAHTLNDLIDRAWDWNLQAATAVNDAGQIVGYGSHPFAFGEPINPHAFLLTPRIPGDATLDGAVNFSDLLILAQDYGMQTTHFTQGDFDGDGTVGFPDLLLLAQHYGQGSAAAAFSTVPEPGGLPLLAVAALYRRRVRRDGPVFRGLGTGA